jgi:hypothetical protein
MPDQTQVDASQQIQQNLQLSNTLSPEAQTPYDTERIVASSTPLTKKTCQISLPPPAILTDPSLLPSPEVGIDQSLMPKEDQGLLVEALSFLSPLRLAQAMRAEGWTPDVEIQVLVAIARQTSSLAASLGAIKTIRAILTEALVSSGYVESVSRRLVSAYGAQGGSNGQVQCSETRVHSVIRGLQRTDSAGGDPCATPAGGADTPGGPEANSPA